MSGPHPLAQARDELRQVREWLSRPSAQTMSACPPALLRAIACFAEPAPNHDCAADAATLARDIADTQILLTAAAQLYLGSIRRLAEDPQSTATATQPLAVTG
jgi:hypothetical protein